MAQFIYPVDGLHSKLKSDMELAISNLKTAKENASFSTVDSIDLSSISSEIQSLITSLDSLADEIIKQDNLVRETLADISSKFSRLGNVIIKKREKLIV